MAARLRAYARACVRARLILAALTAALLLGAMSSSRSSAASVPAAGPTTEQRSAVVDSLHRHLPGTIQNRADLARVASAPRPQSAPISKLPDSLQGRLAADSTKAMHALAATDSTLDTNATVAAAVPPDYLAEVRAGFTPENRSYSARKTWLSFIETFWGIVVGLLILFSGLSAKMRDVAHGLGRSRYVHVLVFFALYTVIGYALSFPLSWYGGFALEHQYGLSNQTFGSWLADELKGQAVEIAFLGVIPLLMLAYRAIEHSPKRWWLWLSLGTLPVIVFAVLIEPVAIDPMFNKFTPLQNQELKQEILALAAKAEIPGRNVYQVDKSAQTKKLNAYVNGFGASQRIVLWDTTLEAMKDDEILFVMSHEMGHYKLNHVWKGIAFVSALSLLLFLASYLLMTAAVRRFGERWGFTQLHDVASMPLFVVTLALVSLVSQPLVNSQTRQTEHEADLYGLEVTHLNDAAARAFIKLGAQNKSNPEPSKLVEWFLYTHPPLIERVRTAIEYKPWEQGQPNRYFHPTH